MNVIDALTAKGLLTEAQAVDTIEEIKELALDDPILAQRILDGYGLGVTLDELP